MAKDPRMTDNILVDRLVMACLRAGESTNKDDYYSKHTEEIMRTTIVSVKQRFAELRKELKNKGEPNENESS